MQKMMAICFSLFLGSFNLQASESGDITYKIIGRHINHYKKFGFGVMGTGAAIPDLVNWIDISYHSNEDVDITKARTMIVSMTNSLLDLSNNIECYKKYMCKYPFTAENASISIGFPGKMHLYKMPPHLAFVMVVKGEITYFQYDDKKEKFKEIFNEKYEDALMISNAAFITETS